ncbi:hypothetical protein A3H10_01225 [Candidatus Uhrbacteria bacterium RIFCSPLOWO2_12_FULL_46_10]|uniref:2'-5' RNA ligase n=1 Tax=Candidatus Uhrbacteria bacterium RIFCSPLOWO2_01_FULL_47_25 TaxID=1802402 RepID=A0A1F7UPJ5_9BACT|nr:MAG: hypothetical protein UX68_C0019G0021 [Parcubacteria group bacterium GW2011_GWA2_46_9]OGL59211.1 MAG: hypothetical protein A2752_01895 [Candidatus Uhrbacteria bacterium RIFCSPHIGHO2_01_FULL_46_23]OGL69157.1 MAG: hypothetical protein A3D60_04630 [Candidatus Uhrbacteria bacterium RIFCSPHIGHO2_02_FULL_47_29]OGL75562.1 MAG: hypothetical protein A3E96_03000 [Candidatus Uhrbacteria bacterium RIFCSPHIGHO2_12_FULL_46_13]OGL80220.1 MAG: hypothetical protein A2936_02535 [Candidatus Uhrbacteria bac
MPHVNREIILFIKISVPSQFSKIIMRAKKLAGIVSFSGYRFSPHITLYLCRFPRSNMPALLRAAQKLKRRHFALTIESASKGLTAERPYYFLKIKGNQNLFLLHNDIVRSANSLRNGFIRSVDHERLSLGLYSAMETRMVKKYGYPMVKSQFQPHITIGLAVLNDRRQFNELKRNLLKTAGKSFWVNSFDISLQIFDVSLRQYVGTLERHKITLKKI